MLQGFHRLVDVPKSFLDVPCGLTDKQLSELSSYLIGTANSIDSGLAIIGIDESLDMTDIEDALLDKECELCRGCGWWHESSDLAADDDESTGLCEDCRE